MIDGSVHNQYNRTKVNATDRLVCMTKTLTIRIEGSSYKRLKNAALAQRRSIANFIEYAALSYVENENFVSDEEMQDIKKNKNLIRDLKEALRDVKMGRYRVVR